MRIGPLARASRVVGAETVKVLSILEWVFVRNVVERAARHQRTPDFERLRSAHFEMSHEPIDGVAPDEAALVGT